MLEVEDIHTYYGDSHVLHGLSVRVRPGEFTCLLGRNGVGKSTAIASIVGWAPPRRGRIRFRGEDITAQPPHVRAGHGIGLVPQGRRVFPNLTVRENLCVAARGDEHARWSLDSVYRLFPRLQQREQFRANRLSGGEQSMLAISRALMTNPALLIMDEPSEGLSPKVVEEVKAALQGLKQEGCSILLVEQNLPLALAVADRLSIVTKGRVVWEGAPHDLESARDIAHRHLGV